MSIWDSIENAFKSAGNAIANAGEGVAMGLVSGTNLFAAGWRDVFNGDFQQGFSEVGFGMARCVGIPVPGITGDTYADIIGQASQWSAQQAQTTGGKVCFREYVQQVKDRLQALNIPWADSMMDPLRAGAAQLSWIDMSC